MRPIFVVQLLILYVSYDFQAYCAPADLGQRTRALKEQAMHILALEGFKYNKTEFSNDTTWDDIEMTEELYKHIKSGLDAKQKELEKSGRKINTARWRLAAPDFSRIPDERWTEMPIKYTLQNVTDESTKQVIRLALNEIQNESNSCITFEELREAPESGSFIRYWTNESLTGEGGACGVSHLGKQKSGNLIKLATKCMSNELVLHETLHSLGFRHTMDRPDAHLYLTINKTNIHPNYTYTLAKFANALPNQGPFDYSSVMMYSAYVGAADPRYPLFIPTKDTNRNLKLMGNLHSLSTEDKNMLKKIYCLPPPKISFFNFIDFPDSQSVTCIVKTSSKTTPYTISLHSNTGQMRKLEHSVNSPNNYLNFKINDTKIYNWTCTVYVDSVVEDAVDFISIPDKDYYKFEPSDKTIKPTTLVNQAPYDFEAVEHFVNSEDELANKKPYTCIPNHYKNSPGMNSTVTGASLACYLKSTMMFMYYFFRSL